MSRATVTAVFGGPDQVTVALERIRSAKLKVDQASAMVGSLIKPTDSQRTQPLLWKQLAGWALSGAVIGCITGYMFVTSDPTLRMPLLWQTAALVHSSHQPVAIGITMAFTGAGATLGHLLGELFDIIIFNRLDEFPEEDVLGFTVSVSADDSAAESELKQIFADCGCLQIETVP